MSQVVDNKPATEEAPDKEKGDLIATFEKRYAEGRDHLGGTHKAFTRNKTFAFEEQWDTDERNRREGDPSNPRPCMTFNKVLRLGKRISNDARQANLGIKAVPVDAGSDPLIAEVYNILLRKEEQDNNCISVRQHGFEDALFGGIGFYRVYTDWEHPMSFDQKIVTKRIVNPKMVLWDKAAIEPDLSDAQWFIIYEHTPKEKAKAEYPDVDWTQINNSSDSALVWEDSECYTIAEYFYIKWVSKRLVRIPREQTGTDKEKIVWEDNLDADDKLLWDALPADTKKANSRMSAKPVYMWCKLAGREIIDQQEWEGEYLPIIFVPGREVWLDNKRKWYSITDMLRDPQILYNLYRSTQSERLTIADDAPWVLTPEHIAGFEDIWKTAHLVRRRFLLVNLKDAQNMPLPPPQRNNPILNDIGIDQEIERLDREILDISGINLSTLGEQAGEKSGKAIIARAKQGELINADFLDGLILAMRREGKIKIDLIPRIYSWEKVERILGEEQKPLLAKLKAKGVFDWGNGRYDIEVEIGSVSTSKMQEEVEFWQTMIQANPNLAPVVLDVLVEQSGSPKSKLIAKRLRAMMPPQMQDITDGDDEQGNQVHQQVQAAQAQAQQQVQQMQQQVQAQLAEGQQASTELAQLKADQSLKWQELQLKKSELNLKWAEFAFEKETTLADLHIKAKKTKSDIANQTVTEFHMLHGPHPSSPGAAVSSEEEPAVSHGE